MECPMCDGSRLALLVNDDQLCDDCGHRWTPDEVLEAMESSAAPAATATAEAA